MCWTMGCGMGVQWDVCGIVSYWMTDKCPLTNEAWKGNRYHCPHGPEFLTQRFPIWSNACASSHIGRWPLGACLFGGHVKIYWSLHIKQAPLTLQKYCTAEQRVISVGGASRGPASPKRTPSRVCGPLPPLIVFLRQGQSPLTMEQ